MSPRNHNPTISTVLEKFHHRLFSKKSQPEIFLDKTNTLIKKLITGLQYAGRSFFELFFNKRHTSHRILGLAFLVQYLYALYLYCADYQAFVNSWVMVTMPVTGVLQPINATVTFWFLPKKQIDGGYFSYKPGNKQGTLSYAFIKENIFFAGILCFQWLYYNDRVYPYIHQVWPLEYLFVFLPYVVRNYFPHLFPRTSFRDSMKNQTGEDQRWYKYMTWVTKIFYIWAKHFLGFFLNYYRFLGLATPYDVKCIHMILISSSFATTIAIFLHTLRFKGYLDPKVSLMAYIVSYMSTFIGYGMITHVFYRFPVLSLLTLGGVWCNLQSNTLFDIYQGLMMLFLVNLPHMGRGVVGAVVNPSNLPEVGAAFFEANMGWVKGTVVNTSLRAVIVGFFEGLRARCF